MKTAEEFLNSDYYKLFRDLQPFYRHLIVEVMKEYTIEAVREALKNASENAKYTTEDIEFCYRVTIDKQSILNDKNIPEL